MPKVPKVTVVIPNYNHARHLSQRIESVLHQTLTDLDVLILDDCSTDDSCAIINQYAQQDARIRTIYNDENSGSTFKQWNLGFAHATGEYLWIAESDDYADMHFLETLVARLDADSTVGIAYCGSWNVDDAGQVTDDHKDFYYELDDNLWRHDFTMDGSELVRHFMSYRCIIPNASAAVLRRTVATQTGRANEQMRLVGDWLFWAKLLHSSRVTFVAEQLNYFRQHGNNVRSRSALSGLSLVEETFVLNEMKQYGEPDSSFYHKKIESILSKWFYAMVYFNVPLKNHWAIFRNLKKQDKSFPRKFTAEFSRFLFANRWSGVRQFVGDKWLYALMKKDAHL